MSLLGRPMNESLIIDNSPTSYTFHPENAIPILSWYDDPKDRCLFELIPLLESLSEVDDVRKYIPMFVTHDNRVDFQRASHVLANAVINTAPVPAPGSESAKEKQRAAAMIQMHRVSEHREEDEEDDDNDDKKSLTDGELVVTDDLRQDPSLPKFKSEEKKGQPMLNQWTLDDPEGKLTKKDSGTKISESAGSKRATRY